MFVTLHKQNTHNGKKQENKNRQQYKEGIV